MYWVNSGSNCPSSCTDIARSTRGCTLMGPGPINRRGGCCSSPKSSSIRRVTLARSLYQGEFRVHLDPIEHDFRAGGRDVEVADCEVRRKLGEQALGTRSKIEE